MSISRQQLKKNELADFVAAAAEWIRGNRQTFLTGVAVAAGALLFIIFIIARYHTVTARATEKLGMAEAYLYQGQPEQGVAMMDEIINQYSRTSAASRARIEKAEYLLSQKRFDDAENSVAAVVSQGKPKSLQPLALELQGSIRESAGKIDAAIQSNLSFIEKYPDHFLAPRVYESLAREYELMNAPAEARSTYEKMATLFPGSPWAQLAQQRLAVLSPQAPSAPSQPSQLPQMPPAPPQR